jgi:uncharacterized protein (TIRG00374 family)
VAVVAALVYVLPRIIDFRAVLDALGEISWPWLVALSVAAALNVVTFAPSLMAALPGLKFRSALAVTLSSTASTYVAPGGAAVGVAATYAMLRGWGFRGSGTTLAVAVTTAWNVLFTFSAPSIALILLSISGDTNRAQQTAALIGFAAFVTLVVALTMILSSTAGARWVGDRAAAAASRVLRVFRRDRVRWDGEKLASFRDEALGLISRRWFWLTVGTISGHMTVYLVLVLTLPAVGVSLDEVSLAESFAAWSVVRLIASLPLTPGGIGIVEVGLTGSLIAFGGDRSEVVAAVLVYRFLTVVPPIVLGGFFAATWRRHHPGWEEEEGETAAVAS